MATETNWDAGATTWDRDWDGPGTRTRWDFIGDVLGRGVRVVWTSLSRTVSWDSIGRKVGWTG